MEIINEALLEHEDVVNDLPLNCNNNLDACECTGNCEISKLCY